jgi:hypothetical protein
MASIVRRRVPSVPYEDPDVGEPIVIMTISSVAIGKAIGFPLDVA